MSNKSKELHGKQYVERFESEQSENRLERLVSRFSLNPDMTVCDYACGNGMMLSHIHSLVGKYTGVDFSQEFIVSAKRRASNKRIMNAEFYCDDIVHFCSNHLNEFDAGFAMDFSEHVLDDEWLTILKAIKTSLKPGANLYLHTPNADFFIEIMKDKNLLLKQFPEHVAVRNGKENKRLLLMAGFKQISLEYIPHYNLLGFFHPLSAIPFIGRYFQARVFIKASA